MRKQWRRAHGRRCARVGRSDGAERVAPGGGAEWALERGCADSAGARRSGCWWRWRRAGVVQTRERHAGQAVQERSGLGARVEQQQRGQARVSGRAGERLMVQAHGQIQATLEVIRELRERDGRIEDAAKMFDEMPMRTVPKNARVLLLDEASRMQDAVGRMLRRCAEQRCAGAARQGRGKHGSSR
jgi:hypothetical protein